MPVLPDASSKESLPSLMHAPADSGSPLSPLTSVRPPRQPTPQAWHGCGVPPALGMWQLSSAWQPEVRPRLSPLRAVWECRPHAMRTPWWCPLPTAVHHHLKSPSVCHSRHCQIHVPLNTFVRTRPFASLQILAMALSRENPLRPNIPTRAQAARWWPQTSRRRPHRQLRSDRGRGCRRRRRSTTLNKCEGIVVSLPVGRAVRAAPAPGPACERIKALS